MAWNHDISKAPRGHYDLQSRKVKDGKEAIHEIFRPQYIWLASKCGIVTLSRWIPPEVSPGGKPMKGGRRWEFFSRNEQPIAWHPFDPSDTYQEPDPKSGKPVTKYRKPEHPGVREAA